ncbi:MAG: circadian clock KaiB family protein [Pleurocapsa sp.]
MVDRQPDLPQIFKGIALFTPGGDLIYGVDPSKQSKWHFHLCLGLQEIWGLSDPPHFLVPGYTATVERYFDSQTQKIKTIAEAYPAVQSYIPLLQVLFNLKATQEWQIAPWQEEHCNRAVLETYRDRFSQLWEDRDLIVRLDPKHFEEGEPIELRDASTENLDFSTSVAISDIENTRGYILHLFISSDRPTAEQTLASIHQVLERGLTNPYTLRIIDIAKNPEQAEIYQVAATPTLVRVWPQPVKRIVGQLDDIQRVIRIISSL